MSREPFWLRVLVAGLAAIGQMVIYTLIAWVVCAVAFGNVMPSLIANASGWVVFRLCIAAVILLTVANFIDFNRK